MGRNCMRKLLLLVVVFASQLVGSQYVPDKLGNARILLLKKGFVVKKDGKKHKIAEHNLDPLLRKMNSDQRMKYFTKGHVDLNQLSDGDYTLKANPKIKGGGILGATIGAFFGKAVVSIIGHGAIGLVGLGATLFTGPVGGWAVVTALESTCGVMIEGASIKGAIAGGIAGGVATGPI